MVTLLAIIGRLRRHHVVALLSVAVVSTLIGAFLFSVSQHVSLTTSLYWAVTTATTVGYGDVTPHDSTGRAIAVGLMLTTIPVFGAVFAMLAGVAALAQIRRLFAMDHSLPSGSYAVVYGMHSAVPKILDELSKTGCDVVMVADVDPGSVPPGITLIAGDPANEDVIRKSHPERAQQALVAGAADGDVLVTCVALRALAPSLEVSALTQSPKVAQALRELGISRTVSGDELVGHTLAKCLEAPHTAELLLRLVDSDAYRMREVEARDADLCRHLSEVRGHSRRLILGLAKDDGVTLGVDEDPIVGPGDRLLVLSLTGPEQASAGA